MVRVKNFIVVMVGLLVLWVIFTGTFFYQEFIVGFSLAVIIAAIATKNMKCEAPGKLLSPKRFIYAVIYLFHFFWAVIKSNLDVARRVINPRLPINPGIVKVKTRLRDPFSKLVLANSITLTPGTLSVDIKDDILYIHWIDVKDTDIAKATQDIVSGFEKYLEVIFE